MNCLQSAIEFIHTNNGGRHSLKDLAAIARISPHHFAARFKQAMGYTPHQYVLRKRVEYSKLLLTNTNLNIVEVGEQAGFLTQEHFTKVFHKIAGLTPGAFRKKSQGSQLG